MRLVLPVSLVLILSTLLAPVSAEISLQPKVPPETANQQRSQQSDGMCELAGTIAEKAVQTFADDKAEGLKLFIKAAELCPGESRHLLNLASAYYQYGRLAEARQQLEKVLELEGRNVTAMNNLAQILLEQQGDAALALRHAEAADKLKPGTPAFQETLARARCAADRCVDGLQGLRAALAASTDKRLQITYADLLDQYLAAQLTLIKDGRVNAGLTGLAALPDEPLAVRTRAQVLARLGRGEEALAVVAAARQKFPQDRELPAAADAVAAQVVAALYADFQAGQGAQAVARSKKLAEANPGITALKHAYDKLFEALLADVKTIAVPDSVARAGDGGGSGRSSALLTDLGAGSDVSREVDLAVDVDSNIPLGQKAGKYDVAVVIGNRDYGVAGTPNVDYALRDARVMRQYLEKTLGFEPGMILYEENASYARFNELFGNERDHQGKLFRYVREGESRVFVYYVGHGAPDVASGEAYFVPVDANPDFLKTNGYRLQTFYDNLAQLPAKEVTVVLDACFSGSSAKGTLLKGVSGIAARVKALQEPASATVFTSARDDQYSAWYSEKRHGLFTYFFLKGLQGEADKDRDRRITVAEMEKYLEGEVSYNAKKLRGTFQNPTVSGSRERVLAVLK